MKFTQAATLLLVLFPAVSSVAAQRNRNGNRQNNNNNQQNNNNNNQQNNNNNQQNNNNNQGNNNNNQGNNNNNVVRLTPPMTFEALLDTDRNLFVGSEPRYVNISFVVITRPGSGKLIRVFPFSRR